MGSSSTPFVGVGGTGVGVGAPGAGVSSGGGGAGVPQAASTSATTNTLAVSNHRIFLDIVCPLSLSFDFRLLTGTLPRYIGVLSPPLQRFSAEIGVNAARQSKPPGQGPVSFSRCQVLSVFMPT